MKRAAVIAVVVLVVAMLTPIPIHYARDIAAARSRVTVGSTLLDDDCATMEYATAGDGAAVLVIHGAGGGFDQGMAFGRAFADAGVQVIAPSRYGYLRTPVPPDASAEAQADDYACLLDRLGVDRAAIVGASAGAPSALQFCIRHPQRCSALVIVVPAAYAPEHARKTMHTSPALQLVFEHVLSSDGALWLLRHLWPELLVRTMLGTPTAVFEDAPEAERARTLRMLDEVLPVSQRRQGLLNDARVTTRLPRYELERIAAPMLAISVQDDLYGTFENARYTASQVPGSRFVSYPSGGHVWLGHHEEMQQLIAAFVAGTPD